MKLKNQRVLITGGAKGIGQGCAAACVRHGAAVVIADIDRAAGAATAAELTAGGGRVEFIAADVSSEENVKELIDRTAAALGGIDGLVNNAGIHPPARPIEKERVWDFDAVLRVNLTSTYMATKFALPHLLKSRGSVVIMSSAVAMMGQAQAPAYVASKAGQLGLCKALALDLAPAGVRVNAVCPSNVDTPLMRDWAATLPDPKAAMKRVASWQPINRMATAEEIGEIVAFLLSSESAFLTGQTITADGGAMLGYGVKA